VTTKKKTTTKPKAHAHPKIQKAAPRAPSGGRDDDVDSAAATASYDKGKWAWVFKRPDGEQRYWLVKTEPEIFSFDDLLRRHGRTTCWDGVRNFAARNFLRDGMKMGDRVLFYHSMSEPQMIVGECEVAREGYVDHTAFDVKHRHYDAESKADSPQWYMVDLRAVAQYTKPVTLEQIKLKHSLRDMTLVRIGRLSVSPVTEKEYKVIRSMAGDITT
jgi:predicted RNA-binding protein with PUA-like domain